HRGGHDALEISVADLPGLAGAKRTFGRGDEVIAKRRRFCGCGLNRHCNAHDTPGRSANTCAAFGRLRLTSRPKIRAALSPKMLRLAWSDRNDSVVIALGGSKSQCGQSDAYSNCVSALNASIVACSSFKLVFSSGWLV